MIAPRQSLNLRSRFATNDRNMSQMNQPAPDQSRPAAPADIGSTRNQSVHSQGDRSVTNAQRKCWFSRGFLPNIVTSNSRIALKWLALSALLTSVHVASADNPQTRYKFAFGSGQVDALGPKSFPRHLFQKNWLRFRTRQQFQSVNEGAETTNRPPVSLATSRSISPSPCPKETTKSPPPSAAAPRNPTWSSNPNSAG